MDAELEQLAQLTKEEGRLFSGERLWLLASTFSRVHGRLFGLAAQSLEEKRYVDWKTDKYMSLSLVGFCPRTSWRKSKGRKWGILERQRTSQGAVSQGGCSRYVRLTTRRRVSVGPQNYATSRATASESRRQRGHRLRVESTTGVVPPYSTLTANYATDSRSQDRYIRGAIRYARYHAMLIPHVE